MTASRDTMAPLLSEGSRQTQPVVPYPTAAWAFYSRTVTQQTALRGGVEPRGALAVVCWFDEAGEVTRTREFPGAVWAGVSDDGSVAMARGGVDHRDRDLPVTVTCVSASDEVLLETQLPDGDALLSPDGTTFLWRLRDNPLTELRTCRGDSVASVPGYPGQMEPYDAGFSPSGSRVALVKSLRSDEWSSRLTVMKSDGALVAEVDLPRANRVSIDWHDEQVYAVCTPRRASASDPHEPVVAVTVSLDGDVTEAHLAPRGGSASREVGGPSGGGERGRERRKDETTAPVGCLLHLHAGCSGGCTRREPGGSTGL